MSVLLLVLLKNSSPVLHPYSIGNYFSSGAYYVMDTNLGVRLQIFTCFSLKIHMEKNSYGMGNLPILQARSVVRPLHGT